MKKYETNQKNGLNVNIGNLNINITDCQKRESFIGIITKIIKNILIKNNNI